MAIPEVCVAFTASLLPCVAYNEDGTHVSDGRQNESMYSQKNNHSIRNCVPSDGKFRSTT
jgi:hypothetical protein